MIRRLRNKLRRLRARDYQPQEVPLESDPAWAEYVAHAREANEGAYLRDLVPDAEVSNVRIDGDTITFDVATTTDAATLEAAVQEVLPGARRLWPQTEEDEP